MRLAESFAAAHSEMVKSVATDVNRMFRKYFRMTDGDYIDYECGRSQVKPIRRARILYAQEVYWNAKGGLTAVVMVTPLLASGKLGNSRQLTLAVNPDGTELRMIGGGIVRKPAQIAADNSIDFFPEVSR